MKLPDGKKTKSLVHYCQVRGVLLGVGFTSGLFLRQCDLLIIDIRADDNEKTLPYEGLITLPCSQHRIAIINTSNLVPANLDERKTIQNIVCSFSYAEVYIGLKEKKTTKKCHDLLPVFQNTVICPSIKQRWAWRPANPEKDRLALWSGWCLYQ